MIYLFGLLSFIVIMGMVYLLLSWKSVVDEMRNKVDLHDELLKKVFPLKYSKEVTLKEKEFFKKQYGGEDEKTT